jgi:ribosome-binding factor A
MLRVGEQVRAAITQVLQRGEVRDSLIEATVISISEVRMSTDLKHATAYVTPLGVKDHGTIIEALNRNAKFIRGRLGSAAAPDEVHARRALPRRHELRQLQEDRRLLSPEVRDLAGESTTSDARRSATNRERKSGCEHNSGTRCPSPASPRAGRFPAG